MNTKNKRLLVLTSLTLLITLVCLVVWELMGGFAFLRPITVKYLISGETRVHAVEATSALCSDIPCVEGWKTDVGNFLRFEREGQAIYWATILGDDCRRDGKILVDFSGFSLSVDQKKDAVDYLFVHRDWY
jgi:hypothetical protein